MMGKFWIWIMITLSAMLWMGCGSSSAPPAYYGLQTALVQPGQSFPESQLTVGVGPVQLPDYLDRAPIVTRLNPNRLQVHEGHRWAGSLQSEILRVLAANIKQETGSPQVVVFPWGSDFEPDIRIRIFIHAFEGRPAHSVRLKATWSITRPPSSQTVLLRDSEVVEKVNGDGFDSLTEAMGRSLGVLSQEIATTAKSMNRGAACGLDSGQKAGREKSHLCRKRCRGKQVSCTRHENNP